MSSIGQTVWTERFPHCSLTLLLVQSLVSVGILGCGGMGRALAQSSPRSPDALTLPKSAVVSVDRAPNASEQTLPEQRPSTSPEPALQQPAASLPEDPTYSKRGVVDRRVVVDNSDVYVDPVSANIQSLLPGNEPARPTSVTPSSPTTARNELASDALVTATRSSSGWTTPLASSDRSGEPVNSVMPIWKNGRPGMAIPRHLLGTGESLRFPLTIPAIITSVFGWRTHPITGDRRFHSGTDLGAPMGTPVLAAYAGKVAITDFLSGYGLTVVLSHDRDHAETLYGYLSEILVKPGEWVKQGSVIGRVGSTGLSTGPHLHFEFRQLTNEGWVALDPGAALEYALAQLVQSLQVAQSVSKQGM